MDLMIDIESLGTRQSAKITQIGAVMFYPHLSPGNFAAEFNVYLDLESQDDRTVDLDTLRWWSTQDPSLYRQMLDRCEWGEAPSTAIQKLNDFCMPYTIDRVWANGVNFDLGCVQHMAEQNRQVVPWQLAGGGYRLPRCMRGLKDALDQISPGFDVGEAVAQNVNLKGQMHDALYDSKWQASAVQATYNHLGWKI